MHEYPKYGRSLTYSLQPGQKTKLTVEGRKSMSDANICLAHMLVNTGYRYPKWHEWWRWYERRPTRDLSIRIDDELAKHASS